MIGLGRELSLDFHRGFEGREMNVLWESAVGADEAGLRWVGYTDNYIRALGSGTAELFNRVTRTYLSEARPDGMRGVVGETAEQLTG
jgi:hypothetical protein